MQRPISIGLKELVWRKGDERCERSYKSLSTTPPSPPHPPSPTTPSPSTPPSVLADESITAAPARHVPDGFRQVSTKREEASAKINERYLVGQATQNPFMSSNNYINDIEVQMNFLTPQKS